MATLYVDPASGWELPVDGGLITQGYGPENTDPSVRGLYRKGYHTGVDIGGVPENCPIKSPRDASVILAGPNAGYGNCVILECSDGLRLLFGHLFRIGVSVGDSVVRGQEIGGVGTTGVSTGVHLHYEYRHGDDDINPVPFLSPAAPVPTGLTATVKEDLNLRTGPTKNDPIITTLSAGTVVQVGQDGWLPVNFQGRQGWMYADYLQVNTGPAASAAAARAPRAPVTKLPRKRPQRAKQP